MSCFGIRIHRHNDEKLDALLGKNVTITFFDGEVKTGVLGKSPYSYRYSLDVAFYGRYEFAKSLVKKVEQTE